MIKTLLLVGLLLPSLALASGPLTETNTNDPFEEANRVVFAFNDRLDQWVLKPFAQGYRAVLPDVAERGVGNVFLNLSEFNSAANSILQGKLDAAMASGGRFAVNTTLGIGGLFDVASAMGMRSRHTDLGETLAVWGCPSRTLFDDPIFWSIHCTQCAWCQCRCVSVSRSLYFLNARS